MHLYEERDKDEHGVLPTPQDNQDVRMSRQQASQKKPSTMLTQRLKASLAFQLSRAMQWCFKMTSVCYMPTQTDQRFWAPWHCALLQTLLSHTGVSSWDSFQPSFSLYCLRREKTIYLSISQMSLKAKYVFL